MKSKMLWLPGSAPLMMLEKATGVCGGVLDAMALKLPAEAARAGADAFATTLTLSPHQDHALIREVAEAVARDHGVPFFYRDWRDVHDAAQEKARRMNLYRQQYCGCIFSEFERFRDTSRGLYKGDGKVACPGG